MKSFKTPLLIAIGVFMLALTGCELDTGSIDACELLGLSSFECWALGL